MAAARPPKRLLPKKEYNSAQTASTAGTAAGEGTRPKATSDHALSWSQSPPPSVWTIMVAANGVAYPAATSASRPAAASRVTRPLAQACAAGLADSAAAAENNPDSCRRYPVRYGGF